MAKIKKSNISERRFNRVQLKLDLTEEKDKTNNYNMAYYRIKNVTFWVEYTIEGGKYLVYNAYSHRMKIEVN